MNAAIETRLPDGPSSRHGPRAVAFSFGVTARGACLLLAHSLLRSYLALCHRLTFGYPVRRHSPGRRGRLAAGDLKDRRTGVTGLKAGASGSVANRGLFLPSEIYRLAKHWASTKQLAQLQQLLSRNAE